MLFDPQGFITVMDALKLKLRAKDQLHPLLSELMTGYTRFKASNEWEGRPKILHWLVLEPTIPRITPTTGQAALLMLLRPYVCRLIALNQMRASEEVTEEQSRQMLFDLEHAYSE